LIIFLDVLFASLSLPLFGLPRALFEVFWILEIASPIRFILSRNHFSADFIRWSLGR